MLRSFLNISTGGLTRFSWLVTSIVCELCWVVVVPCGGVFFGAIGACFFFSSSAFLSRFLLAFLLSTKSSKPIVLGSSLELLQSNPFPSHILRKLGCWVSPSVAFCSRDFTSPSLSPSLSLLLRSPDQSQGAGTGKAVKPGTGLSPSNVLREGVPGAGGNGERLVSVQYCSMSFACIIPIFLGRYKPRLL